MAPTVTVELFNQTVLPQLQAHKVKRLNQFHLTDVTEQADPTCKPILFYSRSLLYLVSESFEHGMSTHFDQYVASLGLKHVHGWPTPLGTSQSTTHAGFDNDATRRRGGALLV